MSSDGILRLDLDLEGALMPNGTHHASVDGTETPKEAAKVPSPPSNAGEAAEKQSGPIAEEKEGEEEEAQTEPEVSPQKKVIKPPMPPTKEAKPSATAEGDVPEKKVCIMLYNPSTSHIQCRYMCVCLSVWIT